MKRDNIKYLRQWRNSPLRSPLLLRGARQVGKSWLADCFGQEFDVYIKINFERDQRAHQLFPEHIDIKKTLEQLSVYVGKKIEPGRCLIFFDEIQECPQVLTYLRYFKEDCPEVHVMAAGSLLDFILDEMGMPVGRVEYLYVYPLSFLEFLTANELDHFREQIINKNIDPASHEVLLEHLKNYMWLGGMPAVVDAWLKTRDSQVCQSLQDRIIENYRDDFNKYAKKKQIPQVAKVFQAIPKSIGGKFKYAHVDAESQAYPLKQALGLLCKAGIVYRCYHSSGQSYPLGADMDEKKFKAFFFDIGIAHRILGLDLSEWVSQPMELKYLGASAEQLVAQEMIAYAPENKAPQLYYWHNESSTINSEVDFLVVYEKQIMPVEVKSKIKGGMKSLRVYLEKHSSSKKGIKISEGPFAEQLDLVEIPLYGVVVMGGQ